MLFGTHLPTSRDEIALDFVVDRSYCFALPRRPPDVPTVSACHEMPIMLPRDLGCEPVRERTPQGETRRPAIRCHGTGRAHSGNPWYTRPEAVCWIFRESCQSIYLGNMIFCLSYPKLLFTRWLGWVLVDHPWVAIHLPTEWRELRCHWLSSGNHVLAM